MLQPSLKQYCKRRWGVVQLVGHLTVNEDGEGSNPSAPANLFWCLAPRNTLTGYHCPANSQLLLNFKCFTVRRNFGTKS